MSQSCGLPETPDSPFSWSLPAGRRGEEWKETPVKAISKLKYYQLAYLAKPACNRILFRTICKHRVASIMEIGIVDLRRTEQLIRLASRSAKQVRYTGVDLFEGRSDCDTTVSLKEAHRVLKRCDCKLQLVPGDVHQALTRVANAHLRTDLIVISAGYDPQQLDAAWFYVPRMLHAASTVLVQPSNDPQAAYEPISRLEIERRIASSAVKPQAA